MVGDFKFCLIRKTLSPETDLSGINRGCIELKYFIRGLCGSPARWYGLENSSLIFEYVPLFSKTKRQHRLTRIERDELGHTGQQPALAPDAAESEEDEDIFSVQMREDREATQEEAEKALVGGDTAAFKPLRLDEEEGEPGSAE